MSLVQAMNISVTTLKRLCRRHGVKRWPHRQISGINRAMAHLEFQQEQAGRHGDKANGKRADPHTSHQMQELLRRRRVMIEVRSLSGRKGWLPDPWGETRDACPIARSDDGFVGEDAGERLAALRMYIADVL